MCYVKEGSSDSVFFYVCHIFDTVDERTDDDYPDRDLAVEPIDYDYFSPYNKSSVLLHEMISNIDYVMFGGFKQPTFSETVISPDGAIRIVNFAEKTGSNGRGSVENKLVLAYESDGGTSLLFDFMHLYANKILMDAPNRQMNFGFFQDFKIHCVYINGETYYLIESHPYDDIPGPIEYGKDDTFGVSKSANYWCVAAAYSISKGKLVPAPIINGQSTLCIVADSVTRPMFLSVIPDENMLCLPHVESPDYIFSGKYDRIRLSLPR